MGEDRANERRKRIALIAGGLMDAFIGGVIVLLGLGLLPADLLGFHLPPLGALFGAIILTGGMAVAVYNLTRLGE